MDKKYELTVVVESDSTEKVMESIQNLLKLNKAQEINVIDWGEKKLAYIIKKNKTAHYYHIELMLPAMAVNKLQSQLNIENGVLRYLLVQAEDMPEEDSSSSDDNEA